ncbi:MAG TPA: UDP-glucose 4-epimerase GalE [Stellaceae bacterium]|nr:UDP-glucose 4-epimerase GalE [Stellaceae bacterium]
MAAAKFFTGSVLVTGGAGYIGSHVAWALIDAGYRVVVLDNLSYGRRIAVPPPAVFIEGNVGDRELVESIIREHEVSAVMHFAGSVLVHESVEKPLDYYRNNTVNSHALLMACQSQGVQRFIFSSTAAVYGVPDELPILETTRTQPINPYGTSKLMTEMMLRDLAATGALRYVILRYFNVAGADPAKRTGECRPVASHLINIATQLAAGKRDEMAIRGDDYDTPDGTCVRDYVHVSDLADAHVLALETLAGGCESMVLNCGYSRGFSVREVVTAVERVIGRKMNVAMGPRRPGDPPALVAAATRVRQSLNWQPRFDDLETIIRHALEWERTL